MHAYVRQRSQYQSVVVIEEADHVNIVLDRRLLRLLLFGLLGAVLLPGLPIHGAGLARRGARASAYIGEKLGDILALESLCKESRPVALN